MATPDKLLVGCQCYTLTQWARIYQKVAKENDAEDIVDEYLMYYELFCKRYGTDELIEGAKRLIVERAEGKG